MPKSGTRSTRSAARDNKRGDPIRPISMRTRPKPPPAPPKPIRVPKPKKVVLPFLARSLEEAEADVNRKNALFSLPKELIREIAELLPLPSVLCLTVTCKLAVDIIGTQRWIDYKKGLRMAPNPDGTTQQDVFYDLILRDWGHLLEYCHICGTLHMPLRGPQTHRKTRLTTTCLGQWAMIDYLPHDETNGYSLVLKHVAKALRTSEEFADKGSFGPEIDLLSNDFTVSKGNIDWRLVSSGRRVDGNLVVKHVHTLQSNNKTPLRVTDVQALPVRLCPHQSTMPGKCEKSRYINSNNLNGMLLMHSITTAFPQTRQTGIKMSDYKDPTSSEQKQISAAAEGEDIVWQCRSCPTQYKVDFASETLSITSWHSFGRDNYYATKYWKWLVRRTGPTLGPDKRNDEWWSPSRSVPGFMCE